MTDARDIRRSGRDAKHPLLPRPAGCTVPLTALQFGMWRAMGSGEARLSTRIAVTSVRILGPLDTSLLKQCLSIIVQRHETLRTRIILVDDAPVQHIEPHQECCFETIDLTAVPMESIEAEARRIVQELLNAKVDVRTRPQFEARLLRLPNREHILAIAIDHIIADAASCQILNRELWQLYSQGVHGHPFSLPELSVQFADYAVWQGQSYSEWVKDHEPYWRKRLAGAQQTNVPTDDGPHLAKRETITAHYPFGRDLTARLRDVAASERTRLSTVVLAVYASMAAQWLGQHDLVLGFTSHGRHVHPELHSMVGLLAKHMILRVNVNDGERFHSLLNRVNAELHSAYEHYDFGRLPHLFPQPLTQLYFNWVGINSTGGSTLEHEAKKLPITLRPFPVKTAWEVDFLPFFSDMPSGVHVTLAYRADRHTRLTVDRFGRNLRSFASAYAENPEAPVGSATWAP